MGKKRKGAGERAGGNVNYGIQARSVAADVLAVGDGARAEQTRSVPAPRSAAPPPRGAGSSQAPGSLADESATWDYDVFISYASEDWDDLVGPLVEALEARGLSVWFDKAQLTLGDSLRGRIDDGLKASRYGVVVISPTSLAKFWTQLEWDGLVAQEDASGRKRILPVTHEMDPTSVAAVSPTLAGRLSGSSANGIDALAELIVEAVDLTLPG